MHMLGFSKRGGVSRGAVRALGTVLAAGVLTTLSPATASASVAVVGVSAPVAGAIDYTTGTPATGIPPLLSGNCFSGPANLNASVSAAVSVGASTTGFVSTYVGLVSVVGTLTEGPCTNFLAEIATVSGLTVSGTSPTGSTLSCGPFSGVLDRFGAVVMFSATSPSCNVNGVVTGPVSLNLAAVWAPTGSPTLGTTTPIAKASIAGALVFEGAA
jgi:hypothetical protein